MAINHTFNSAQLVKPIVVKFSKGIDWNDEIKLRYSMPKLDDTNVFYRQWCGPGGDDTRSDIFDRCKLHKDYKLGTLLVAVLPNLTKNIDLQDPLEVLKYNGLSVYDTVAVEDDIDIEVKQDGVIALIVNEVVLSQNSESIDAKEFHNAFQRAAVELQSDPLHKIYYESIPLIMYNDNLGSFTVTISPSDN